MECMRGLELRVGREIGWGDGVGGGVGLKPMGRKSEPVSEA